MFDFLNKDISLFVISVAMIAVIPFILIRINNHSKKKILPVSVVIYLSTLIISWCYYYYFNYLSTGNAFASLFTSFLQAVEIFGVETGIFEELKGFEGFSSNYLKNFYIYFGYILHVFAPILTFSLLLSFIKNAFSFIRYSLCSKFNTHIFSELNEKSLSLAKDLCKNNKSVFGIFRHKSNNLVVFTDIDGKSEGLIEEAKRIKAIMFTKDLDSVNFKMFNSSRKISFYLIGDNEESKIRQAKSIISFYDNYKNVSLYIISNDIRTELAYSCVDVKNIQISRINDVQSLIYPNLFYYGENLFYGARDVDGEKVISVVIAGLGKYGREMLSALTWFCQMSGYKLKITAFEKDKGAEDKFKNSCPELMDENHNKTKTDGEAYYEIDIASGVDVFSCDFKEKLSAVKDVSYVFVCLGSDEDNLRASTLINSYYESYEYKSSVSEKDFFKKPVIETVIYDSNITKEMGVSWNDIAIFRDSCEDVVKGVTNFKGKPYNILMTGDLESFYSVETLIASELEELGRKAHMKYSMEYAKLSFMNDIIGCEYDEFCAKIKKQNTNADDATISDAWEKEMYSRFDYIIRSDSEAAKKWTDAEKKATEDAIKKFRYEYNYRSSIAKAMHKQLCIKLGVLPGLMEKPVSALTLEEKIQIGKIEHLRWNAYMRTIGYKYAPKRNDMAKEHNLLVPLSSLTNDDLRKDA